MTGLLFVALLTVILIDPLNAVIDCSYNRCMSNGKQHPLCRYPDPRPSPGCGIVHATGVTQHEMQEIVSKHNEYRTYVAEGFETRGKPGPQPPARNMGLLLWDYQLAETAQRWVNQCSFSDAECVDEERFNVNQITGFKSKITIDDALNTTITDIVSQYYDGVATMDRKDVLSYRDGGPTGYTQIVWAKTEKVGCGKIVFEFQNSISVFWMCLYGPGGNVVGEPLYKVLIF